MVNKVYGIGVGPGDEELLTLKAVKVLKEVNTIFVPISKKGKISIAYDIIKNEGNIVSVVVGIIIYVKK